MSNAIISIFSFLLLVACSADKSKATSNTTQSNIIQETTILDPVGKEEEGIDPEVDIVTKTQESEVINTQVDKVVTEKVSVITEAATSEVKTSPVPAKVVEKVKTDIKETVSNVVTTTKTAVDQTTKPVESVTVNVVPTEVEVIEEVQTPAIVNQLEKEVIEEVAKPAVKISHNGFDALLKKYVSATGKVNYKGLKSDMAKLDAYLTEVESTNINEGYSRDEQLAYWINAYNAYTIKLILNNYPLKSITDLHGGKPWDKKWITINGKSLSLNNIENDIIRPDFKEPKIHFAVNCAAASCPPLLNAAYQASTLNATLKSQAKKFVNNDKYNVISGSSVTISKIFEWYGEDFGAIVDYLNKYATTEIKSSAKVNYKEYDWSLNE